MDESAEPPRRPEPDADDVDRLQALEQQVRQLTSRLAGWVEAQLVQAVEDRRNDMKALRSELQLIVNEQLAGIRAESASVLSVATRRLEVAQEQLSERLDGVADRAGEAAQNAAALTGSAATEARRLDLVEEQLDQRLARLSDELHGQVRVAAERQRAELDALRGELQSLVAQEAERAARNGGSDNGLEQRVRSAMSRLSESMEAKLAEVAAARTAELDQLRAALDAATEGMGDRVDGVARQAAAATEGMAALRADVDEGTARAEALEQRVKSAVGRLTDSVEGRLGEASTAGRSDLDALRAEVQRALAEQGTEIRTELATAIAALRARSTETRERLGALEEQQRQAGDRLEELVETRLAAIVDRRRGELEELKGELQDDLARQLSQSRTEIGTAVSDSHRRFLLSVERLDERMTALAEQAVAVASGVETVNETVASDGRRIEALELHTRRTDARLTDLVESKLSELAGRQATDFDALRAQVRGVLDDHLAETQAEVASALAEGRQELADQRAELAAETARLQELRAGLDRRAADTVATLEALGTSVEAALREAEERLAERVQARMADLESLATQVAEARGEVASSSETLARRYTRGQDRLKAKMDDLRAKVDGVVEESAKAAAVEAGMLAPIRSDMRDLQAQVAELAEAVAAAGARKKPPAPAPPKPSARERAAAVAARAGTVPPKPKPPAAAGATRAAKSGRRPVAQ
ncbi:MAG: hypothetical protein ACRD1D_10860 [Acidimicrobiales bacterium]